MIRNLLLSACVLAWATASSGIAAAPSKPNIVFILADDMGWGDPHCFNADSKIATPHLDQLAAQGMRFTDAHAAGSVCVPSRYALLTGRYPFRNTGFRNPVKGPLIQPDRPTVATVLRGAGYATAMVGKWHLGFDGGDQFDYSQPLRGGPVDHGFDSFFGQHASLDIPPYFFIANDRCVEPASETIVASSSPDWSAVQGAFWREGKISPSFKHIEAFPIYTRKAVDYIEGRAKEPAGKPFFLYVAFTAPHTPWLPTEAFRGKSLGGLYGDFVTQVDDAVGQVLAALDRAKLSDNTLVFFTSDNGPVWYPEDVKKFAHSAAGPWRGMKGDAWEAGHRMPFIARWPGKIPSGATNPETICFSDMMATFADLAGAKLPADAGEDSFDLTPLLLGEKRSAPLRDSLVSESSSGVMVIRQGPWKLIPQLGSCGFTKPGKIKPGPGDPAGQLYNLTDDPGEQRNLYAENPEMVQRLTALLEKIRKDKRSAP
jgi:arylsulfatase A